MKQKLPEKYINRSKLLKLSLDKGLSAATLLQMVTPMQGKTEGEKEAMAMELVKELEQRA